MQEMGILHLRHYHRHHHRSSLLHQGVTLLPTTDSRSQRAAASDSRSPPCPEPRSPTESEYLRERSTLPTRRALLPRTHHLHNRDDDLRGHVSHLHLHRGFAHYLSIDGILALSGLTRLFSNRAWCLLQQLDAHARLPDLQEAKTPRSPHQAGRQARRAWNWSSVFGNRIVVVCMDNSPHDSKFKYTLDRAHNVPGPCGIFTDGDRYCAIRVYLR